FTVIIPKENRKDLKDIPKKVLRVMKIIAVDHMDEVLRAALRIENPETFLREPSRAVDWRVADRASGDGGREIPKTPAPTVPEPAQPEPH
ncbi:MAG: S16 family serine protease, partial [Polyangia bacterium]